MKIRQTFIGKQLGVTRTKMRIIENFTKDQQAIKSKNNLVDQLDKRRKQIARQPHCHGGASCVS
jgi:hypothetical protein